MDWHQSASIFYHSEDFYPSAFSKQTKNAKKYQRNYPKPKLTKQKPNKQTNKQKKRNIFKKMKFKKNPEQILDIRRSGLFLLIFFYFFLDKILCQRWAKVRKGLRFLRVLFMMSTLWTAVKNILLPFELSFPQHRARCSKYLHPHASLYSPV